MVPFSYRAREGWKMSPSHSCVSFGMNSRTNFSVPAIGAKSFRRTLNGSFEKSYDPLLPASARNALRGSTTLRVMSAYRSTNGLSTSFSPNAATQSYTRNRRRCVPSGRSSTTISPSRSVALCVATPCVLSGAGKRTTTRRTANLRSTR